MVSITLSKDNVKRMVERLRLDVDAHGVNLKQSHAYNIVARTLGFENWNTLAAKLEDAKASDPGDGAKLDALRTFWPSVAFELDRFPWDGERLRHRPDTSQSFLPDKSSHLNFGIPSLASASSRHAFPVENRPDEIAGLGLLGVIAEAVARFIAAFADRRFEYAPESGTEVDTGRAWTTIKYGLVGLPSFDITIRSPAARGGTFEERTELLCQQAHLAAGDLREWAKPLLEQFRASGRPWESLEAHGEWVQYVLIDAKLIERRKAA